MNSSQPEFDRLSASYDDLLRDPIRDRFQGASAKFFHVRKRDLIRSYFRRSKIDTERLSYLDVGCGKGELLTLLQTDFGQVSGCDPSAGMLEAGGFQTAGIDARVMPDNQALPFEDGQFDFVTAVCVYHHVPPEGRAPLTAEVRRVLKPHGVFAVIEHNPYNPATRLIVSRTPVDVGAILLRPGETRSMLRNSAFTIDQEEFFLYFPEGLYRSLGRLESVLRRIPLGGQYATFASLAGR